MGNNSNISIFQAIGAILAGVLATFLIMTIIGATNDGRFFLRDGTRALTGNMNAGGYNIQNAGTVNATTGTFAAATVDSSNVTRSSTYVVCATDAASTWQCDATCDGTTDSTEINAGITVLGTQGGVLQLSDGNFNIGATPISITTDSITLRGVSQGFGTGVSGLTESDTGTKIKSSSAINLIEVKGIAGGGAADVRGVVLEYLYLHGSGKANAKGCVFVEYTDQFKMEHVKAQNCQYGLWADTDNDSPHVSSSLLIGLGVGVQVDDTSNYGVIDGGTHISDNDGAAVCLNGASVGDWTIIGNFLVRDAYGVHIINSKRNTVIGNRIEYAGLHALRLEGDDADNNTLHSNTIQNSLRNGIWVADGDDNSLIANIILANDRADSATYDGIIFSGNANKNLAAVNTSRDNDRYEISVAAGATSNRLIGNDVDGADHVAAINDAGTTTIIRSNWGWITESSGIATIASGTTSIPVNHSLSITPAPGDCMATASENPTNSTGTLWIDTYTSTQLTINVENDPGASNLDVAWSCAGY